MISRLVVITLILIACNGCVESGEKRFPPDWAQDLLIKKMHVFTLMPPPNRSLRSVEARNLMSYRVVKTVELDESKKAFWGNLVDCLHGGAIAPEILFRPEFGLEIDCTSHTIVTVAVSFQDKRVKVWVNDYYLGSCLMKTDCRQSFDELFSKIPITI